MIDLTRAAWLLMVRESSVVRYARLYPEAFWDRLWYAEHDGNPCTYCRAGRKEA